MIHQDGSGETITAQHDLTAVEAVLWELADLNASKRKGYGTDADPFANYRHVAEESGVPHWLPAVQRVIEKRFRLSNWREASVNIDEELRDIALCAVIALVMYREGKQSCPTRPTGKGNDTEASHAGAHSSQDVGRVLRTEAGVIKVR
jgi:hypothetical protein